MSSCQAGDIIPRKIRKPVCRSTSPASAVRVASFGCLPASALSWWSQNSGRCPTPQPARSAYQCVRRRVHEGSDRSHNISRVAIWVLLVPFGAVGVVGVPVAPDCSGALSCSFHPLPPLQLRCRGQCFRRAVGGATELNNPFRAVVASCAVYLALARSYAPLPPLALLPASQNRC